MRKSPEHTPRPNGRQPSEPHTVQDFVRVITAAWNKQHASIRETGRWLRRAKKNLGHGRFLAMIEGRIEGKKLPFGKRMAQRYMRIAKHPITGDATHESHLPPSPITQDLLTRLPHKQLEEMLADGSINAETEREEVEKIIEEIKENGTYWWRKVGDAFEVLIRFADERNTPADLEEFTKFAFETRFRGRRLGDQLPKLSRWIDKVDAAYKRKLADPEVKEGMEAVARFQERERERKQRARRFPPISPAERNRRRERMERLNERLDARGRRTT